MGNLFQEVRPGDLITAELMNRICREIERLDAAVSAIGTPTTGGAVQITSVTPSGTVRVGDTMRVRGENFEVFLGAHRVFFDSTRVLVFDSETTENELVFAVPEIPALPEVGRSVSMIVSNRETSAFRPLIVQPRVEELQGNVDVEFRTVTPQTPQAGQPVTFTFTVRNRTNRTVPVTLSPTVSVTLWQSLLRVVATAQSTTPITSVTLAPDEQRDVFVQITAIPAGSSNQSFTLRLDGSAGDITGTSGAQPFQVGAPAEVPDAAIVSLAQTFTIPDGLLQGGVVRVPGNSSLNRVGFNLVVNVAPATYVVTARPVDAQGQPTTLSGWTVGIVNQDSPGQRSFPIVEADLTNNGSTSRTVEVALVASASAAATGLIEVRVQRQGQTTRRQTTFNVARG